MTRLSVELKVKLTTKDSKFVANEANTGAIFWRPAETRATKNISGQATRAYLIDRNQGSAVGIIDRLISASCGAFNFRMKRLWDMG